MTTAPLGVVASESTPHAFAFLAKRPVRVGEYVVVKTPEGDALGFVEGSVIKSSLMEAARNYQAGIEAKDAAAKNPRDKSNVASVKVLGLLEYLSRGVSYMPSLTPRRSRLSSRMPTNIILSISSRISTHRPTEPSGSQIVRKR